MPSQGIEPLGWPTRVFAVTAARLLTTVVKNLEEEREEERKKMCGVNPKKEKSLYANLEAITPFNN